MIQSRSKNLIPPTLSFGLWQDKIYADLWNIDQLSNYIPSNSNKIINSPQTLDFEVKLKMIARNKPAIRVFWTLIILFSSYYLYRAVIYRFFDQGIGPTFWDKRFWFVSHLALPVIPLVTGPFQFWGWFRRHHLKWHRLLGKAYIIGCLLGGVSVLSLGITQPYPGSVVPTLILTTLWIFVTSAAWISIKNKNIKAHRPFGYSGCHIRMDELGYSVLGS